MRRLWAVFAGCCVTLLAALAVAQSESVPGPVMTGPMTVNGLVNMNGPFVVDGGIVTNELFDYGPALLGPPVTLNGPVTVSGACSFSTPPTGIARSGSFVRGASLTVGIGCASLGTTTVTSAAVNDVCVVTSFPGALTSITYGCFVSTANTVTVYGCGLVALVAAPAGTYAVRVIPGG